MIKICIPERNVLNMNLLAREFDIIHDPSDADVLICTSTVRYPEYIGKTIYLTGEAPLADHRIWCYSNFDKFLGVFCFNPDPNKRNQFPLNIDGEYQYYPSRPDPFPFVTRKDTTIKNRGVFYAGITGVYDNQKDACGGINITPLRRKLGDYLMKEFPSSKFIGIGWNGQNTKVDNWRDDKYKQIEESDCDFVLALENTIYPNYLYEKIWDGFATDRVTLYLGDPLVEEHIPSNCFISLKPYFNTTTKEFDFDKLGDRLRNITQEEYDEIIKNARIFRETSKGKYKYHVDKTTARVIDFIKNGKR
jgi:hypothetical protein